MSTKISNKRVKKSVDLPLGKAPVHEEEVDLSHVRLPIETSVYGLKQVLTLFDTATNEVKRYLAYECSILYECRVCRKIFRSLANFILHKRVYCRVKFSSSEDHFRECRQSDGLSIISEEIVAANEIIRRNENSDDDEPKSKLIPVIEKLIQKQEHKKFVDRTKNEDLSNITNDEKIIKEPFNSVLLEPINTSNVAVFQTTGSALNLGNAEFMKTEVMEIHSILNDDEAIIGSDGKIITTITDKKKDEWKKSIVCTECNQKFSRKKTLVYHVKNKHNDSRIVYPCPECNDDLSNAWSVRRHLSKVHKKTASQIRKCRNQIYNSAVCKKIRELQIKSKKDKTENKDENDEENEWLDNVEGDIDLQMCGGCGKRFERKAALASHSVMCTKRIAICNSIKENNAKKKDMDEKDSKMKMKLKTSKEQISGSAKRKPDCLINYKLKNYNSHIEPCEEDTTNNENAHEIVTLTLKDDNDSKIEESFEIPPECSEDNIQLSDRSESPCKGFETIKQFRNILNEDEVETKIDKCDPVEDINIVESEPNICTSKEDLNHENDSKDYKLQENPENSIEFEINEPINSLKPTDLVIEDSSGIYSINNSIEIEDNDYDSSNVSSNNSIDDDNEDDNDSDQKDEVFSSDDNVPELRKRKRTASSDEMMKLKKIIKCSNENEDEIQDDESFISKISQYIDQINFGCVICDCQFSSLSHLLLHMSIHFSWYRYQCSKCPFMSYNKYDCEGHVHKEHKIPVGKMNSTVLPIPAWKTTSMSKIVDANPIENFIEPSEEVLNNDEEYREFMDLQVDNAESSKRDEIIVGFIDLTEDLEDDNIEETVLDYETESTEHMSRQDIFNVILGNIEYDKNKETIEIIQSSSNEHIRPQRNRMKSVKFSQKDFIYDMDVIGSKMFK